MISDALAAFGIWVAFGTGGRPAADHAICTHLSVQPGTWSIARGASGAPVITGPQPGFHASISYAPPCFVVAVARGRPVGVDIEADHFVPKTDWPLHLMSGAEAALLDGGRVHFLTVWTLKEALAKEAGTGLTARRIFDTARHAAAPARAPSLRGDGGFAYHGRLRLGGVSHHFALCAGPPQP